MPGPALLMSWTQDWEILCLLRWEKQLFREATGYTLEEENTEEKETQKEKAKVLTIQSLPVAV